MNHFLIDTFKATEYLRQRRISSDFQIFLVAARDENNNQYFLVPESGHQRWQTNFEAAIFNRGFWLTQHAAEETIKEMQGIYKESFLSIWDWAKKENVLLSSYEIILARID